MTNHPAPGGGATSEPDQRNSGSAARRDDDGYTDGLIKLPRNTAGAIMALTPLIAVVLFFTTNTWLWFLAIPMVAIVLFGSEGKNERRRERRDQRDEG